MISIIGFVVTFVGIAVGCIAFPCCKECGARPGQILRRLVHLFTLLLLEQKLTLLGAFKKLVYLIALLCFVILAVNGFFAAVVLEKSISGYWIMLQTTAGGVFAVCVAILAVMWARRHRFNESDWPWLQHILERITLTKSAGEESLNRSGRLGQKITFWLLVVLALPLILSMVSSMFTLFGTDGQKLLLELHRYSALLFVLAAIVHIYLVIRTRMSE
jgi:cytochrome b subunit of formate dehydrogenase